MLVLIPALTESLSVVLRESPACALDEELADQGRTPWAVRPCPVPRLVPSLTDQEAACELTEPVVLV